MKTKYQDFLSPFIASGLVKIFSCRITEKDVSLERMSNPGYFLNTPRISICIRILRKKLHKKFPKWTEYRLNPMGCMITFWRKGNKFELPIRRKRNVLANPHSLNSRYQERSGYM
jgi:hypothetical protein